MKSFKGMVMDVVQEDAKEFEEKRTKRIEKNKQ